MVKKHVRHTSFKQCRYKVTKVKYIGMLNNVLHVYFGYVYIAYGNGLILETLVCKFAKGRPA